MLNTEKNTEPTIINRVANSGLITFNLEDYYQPGPRALVDVKPWLFQEMIVKEKDFREYLKNHDWQQYHNNFVALHCSVDVIIPTWAFMLTSLYLQPYAKHIFFGDLQALESQLFLQALQRVDWPQYQNAKVVIKGCSKVQVPTAIYVETANRLRPFAYSIMFGEPCSTVPLFKRK
jgi:Protein of unknown function (DUF2480)